ncbi:hypothetical protein A8708_23640 [Paenibacillus oryzisoli]|uniref:Uncharacterized protein n=2 Tax=Paenibacillus oryzisoli TaxID=1850517 RepID=A0A198A0J1_9BACL|nr:hypothetical protein A8708_23640 [Paenibacillus oryzisoli]
MTNDHIHVVNYLNQLKPIESLISTGDIIGMLKEHQPLAERQWALNASQASDSHVYTKDQLERDSRAPSKNPEDYNSKGEYVPKNGASKNPADYNANGEYKPVESMTKEEKRKELEEMLSRVSK